MNSIPSNSLPSNSLLTGNLSRSESRFPGVQSGAGQSAATRPQLENVRSAAQEERKLTETLHAEQTFFQKLPVADIQRVAQKAGFVGLSERDIQQAYLYGDSLLADYRV